MFLKISQTPQENNCVGVFFYEIAGLQPASVLKRDSNPSVGVYEVCETSKNTYSEEHMQGTTCGGASKKAVLKHPAIFTGRK